MKHAYCIIAHNEPEVLEALVQSIDDERNDIYLLVDKKADMVQFSSIHANKSRFFILSEEQRVDIRWGDESQALAEIAVLEAAHEGGKYEYYHLLSGMDMPIKSQDYIHDFFLSHHGKEFVGFNSSSDADRVAASRAEYRYILTRYYKSPFIVKAVSSALRHLFLFVQRMAGYRRHYHGVNMKTGCNWVSISDDFCSYLLERKGWILEFVKQTSCVDEVFIATLLWNSPFKNCIYDANDEYSSCVRAIDWSRGNPYVWGQSKEDFEWLKQSDAIFARKFSGKYYWIVDRLVSYIVQ